MNRVTPEQLFERRAEIIARFCTARPPRVYLIENDYGLQGWIGEHLHPDFHYATTLAIMDAADAIAESGIANGDEEHE